MIRQFGGKSIAVTQTDMESHRGTWRRMQDARESSLNGLPFVRGARIPGIGTDARNTCYSRIIQGSSGYPFAAPEQRKLRMKRRAQLYVGFLLGFLRGGCRATVSDEAEKFEPELKWLRCRTYPYALAGNESGSEQSAKYSGNSGNHCPTPCPFSVAEEFNAPGGSTRRIRTGAIELEDPIHHLRAKS